MKRSSKFLSIALVVSMILSSIGQAVPVVEEKGEIVRRLAGKGRIETAIEASKEIYKDGANSVVLAGYSGEVDALTGTILAAAKDAPLLLTEKDRLSKATKDEIRRLNSKNIYILGGENIVSKDVISELEDLKYIVKRIAGKSREETTIEIIKEVQCQTEHTFLAKGYHDLTDALSIGPVSAIKNIAIFLTDGNMVSETTLKAMKDLGVKRITIIGGEKAVSKDVEDRLKDYDIDRISGHNRRETALAISQEFFTISKRVILASGYSSADALIGGYIGAKINAPMLLADIDDICVNTELCISDYSSEIYILGGKKSISDEVFKKAKKAAESEKILDIIVEENMELNKNYNTVKVMKDNLVVDLKGKTIEQFTISANDTKVKNGKIINLTIEKDVRDVILEDIIDNEASNHVLEGGGGESIVLKGNTRLKGNIDITSNTSIRIREEGLNLGKGIKGKVNINTDKQVTIATSVEEIEIRKENKSIKIEGKVNKIVALADTEIILNKDVQVPKLEKAKGVKALAKSSDGREYDFVENDKLNAVEVIPLPDLESGRPNPRPDKPSSIPVSSIIVIGEANIVEVHGGRLQMNADVNPSNASDKAVSWSVEEKTGSATISPSGLLTAVANGTVIVKATSISTKTVSGETTITIINQKGEDLDDENSLKSIDISSIEGIAIPIVGETPEKIITDTEQYTGTVIWSPEIGNENKFESDQSYTATITLAPKPGYSLNGVGENFFKVHGAIASNGKDDGLITAVFGSSGIELDSEEAQARGFILLNEDFNGKINKYNGSSKEVVIPSKINGVKVTEIGAEAFKINKVSSVKIANTVKIIGRQSFYSNPITEVVIPNSVITIGVEAFYKADLTKVIIGNSVTKIGNRSFRQNMLTSVIVPNSVTEIGEYAFYSNELMSITIGNSVTTIGDDAFRLNQLEFVIIPNSVVTIGENTFRKNLLKLITIPDSVTTIGNNAFNENGSDKNSGTISDPYPGTWELNDQAPPIWIKLP